MVLCFETTDGQIVREAVTSGSILDMKEYTSCVLSYVRMSNKVYSGPLDGFIFVEMFHLLPKRHSVRGVASKLILISSIIA